MKPPLGLQAEIVYPDGTTKRFDGDAQNPANQPLGIGFQTKRYAGFSDAQLTLPRLPNRENPDIGLYDPINLIGYDGSVAYEGRISSAPASWNTTAALTVQAQGWISHASDEPFVECYIDRDLGKWGAISRARRVTLLTNNYIVQDGTTRMDESGTPIAELSFQGVWASPYKPFAGLLWPPQPGITVGHLYYNLTEASPGVNFSDPEWHVRVGVAANDASAGGEKVSGKSAGYVNVVGTAATLELWYQATPSGAANSTYYANFSQLAVYGNHGLESYGESPRGFKASDIMANIASRFAPLLDISRITPTTFVIPQAAFYTETKPYDAFLTLNTYHRWELAVYEKRQLQFYPIDLSDYDWEIRLSDPGVTVALQGDDTAHLCNGVVVRYRDLNTGYETRLTPTTHPELQSTEPDNPATLNGLEVWTTLSLSEPTTEQGALQIGRTYLAEFNQPKAPGTITVKGHIRDRAGHWQQCWKVRASDRLIIADLPNDSIRVVAETDYKHDAKEITIAVDGNLERLDAILARLGVAVEASGLTLP